MQTKYKKADRIKWVKAVANILCEYGAIEQPRDVSTTSARLFRIKGPSNTYTAKLYPEDDHKLVLSLYGRFDHKARPSHANRKYNLHTCDEVSNEGALIDLKIHLISVIDFCGIK